MRVNVIFSHYHQCGWNTKTIYHTFIRDVFYISRSTFYNYLGLQYKKHVAMSHVDEVTQAIRTEYEHMRQQRMRSGRQQPQPATAMAMLPCEPLTPLKEI